MTCSFNTQYHTSVNYVKFVMCCFSIHCTESSLSIFLSSLSSSDSESSKSNSSDDGGQIDPDLMKKFAKFLAKQSGGKKKKLKKKKKEKKSKDAEDPTAVSGRKRSRSTAPGQDSAAKKLRFDLPPSTPKSSLKKPLSDLDSSCPSLDDTTTPEKSSVQKLQSTTPKGGPKKTSKASQKAASKDSRTGKATLLPSQKGVSTKGTTPAKKTEKSPLKSPELPKLRSQDEKPM